MFYEKGFFAHGRPHHRHVIHITITPPPLTSDARAVTSITISTIRNSCIVNNANIAVQNLNTTPLDAINNWWGMPIGASDQNRSGGDLIGANILSQPHLTIIPPNCDLSDANWIPFNEQELQFAIQSNLPYLNGLDFALLDIVKGVGAKFTLVAKPIYGGANGEAFITITPAPDGSFMRIMLDVSQLPADPNLSKIATCELMPLFMNSLQHVQNKFTNPSQLLEQMVVMDSALMLLFSPPTGITPEPTPEFVLNYDASCLPSVTPPENIVQSGNGESLNVVAIPPLEGEFSLLETGTMQQSQSNIVFLEVDTTLDDANLNACTTAESDCSLRGAVDFAEQNPHHLHVISIPNGTYLLNHSIFIRGRVVLVGRNVAGSVIITRNPNAITSFTPFLIQFFNDAQNNFIPTQTNVAIYNLMITNHLAPAGYPGAIQVNNAVVKIYDSEFINNRGDWGTISSIDYYTDIPSYITIVNSIFDDNRGGIFLLRGNFHVQCSTLKNNQASYGGAIRSGFNAYTITGSVVVENSNLINNKAIVSGGAVYREQGVVILTNNYWSPQADTIPTAPNSVIGSVTIQNPTPPISAELDLDCQVPPPPRPPNSDECLAQTVGGFSIRISPIEQPRNDDTNIIRRNVINRTSIRPSANKNIYVIGNNQNFNEIGQDWWWYVRIPLDVLGLTREDIAPETYTFQDGENSLTGWMINGSLNIPLNCNVPSYDYIDRATEPEMIDLNGVYDYEVAVPIPPWIEDAENSTELIADWNTKSTEEQLREWRSERAVLESSTCQISPEGASIDVQNLHRQNCALIVFVIYYDLFYHLNNERKPKMSDILATGYSFEVKVIEDANGPPDVARTAVAGHYFELVRQYCIDHSPLDLDYDDIVIDSSAETNCSNIPALQNNTEIPTRQLVAGWYKKFDCASEYALEPCEEGEPRYKNGGYLWTLEAWYSNGVAIKNWYYNENHIDPKTRDFTDYIPDSEIDIAILNNKPKERIRTFLVAARDNHKIGLSLLGQGRENSPYLQWANHAYGYNDSYQQVINAAIAQEDRLKYCRLNLYIIGTLAEPIGGGEDVFVVVTSNDNFGQSSTFGQSNNPPSWLFNEQYATSAGFNRIRGGDTATTDDDLWYLGCNCLNSNNQQYPDGERCIK